MSQSNSLQWSFLVLFSALRSQYWDQHEPQRCWKQRHLAIFCDQVIKWQQWTCTFDTDCKDRSAFPTNTLEEIYILFLWPVIERRKKSFNPISVLDVFNEKKLLLWGVARLAYVQLSICHGWGLANVKMWCWQQQQKIQPTQAIQTGMYLWGIHFDTRPAFFRSCKLIFRHDTCHRACHHYSKHVVRAQKGNPKHFWSLKVLSSTWGPSSSDDKENCSFSHICNYNTLYETIFSLQKYKTKINQFFL